MRIDVCESGSSLIINNVSRIEHNLTVKLRSKNILPPAGIGIYYNGSITGGKPFIANSSYGLSDLNDIDVSSYRVAFAVGNTAGDYGNEVEKIFSESE